MRPLFDIISKAKGKTIGQIKDELSIERSKMVKGASGLIVENFLVLKTTTATMQTFPK